MYFILKLAILFHGNISNYFTQVKNTLTTDAQTEHNLSLLSEIKHLHGFC